MVIRVATATMWSQSNANLQFRAQELSDAQTRLTSGKRVLRASDDPAAAAAAERALAIKSRTDAQMRVLDASRNSMTLSEAALGEAYEVVQQAREAILASGNGSFSDVERRLMAERLQGLRGELLAMANRSDGAGRYLFGGQGADGQPLVDAPGGVVFNGAAGQQQGASGDSMPLSIDGRAAFLEAPDPANPGVLLSAFDVLDTAIAELSTPNRTAAQIASTVEAGLRQVDAVMSNLSSWRSRAGEALNRLDNLEARLKQTKLDAETERSSAEDLDMVAAISDFQSKQTGYDAALKTYAMVQRMTLFDHLR